MAPLKLPGALFMTAQGARLRLMRKLGTVRPLTHAKVDDAIVKGWTRPLLTRGIRRDLRKVLVGIKPRYTLDAAAANADFPNPVLIAWGDDDRLFSRKLAERLVADLPHARLTMLEDCAAFAALDQPERLAALIHEHVSAPDASVITLAEPRVSNRERPAAERHALVLHRRTAHVQAVLQVVVVHPPRRAPALARKLAEAALDVAGGEVEERACRPVRSRAPSALPGRSRGCP